MLWIASAWHLSAETNLVSDLNHFSQHSSYLLVSNVSLKQIYSTVLREHFEKT